MSDSRRTGQETIHLFIKKKKKKLHRRCQSLNYVKIL